MARTRNGITPSGGMPTRTSGIEKNAVSVAIATSQQATNPAPPPIAPPCTIAIVGFGSVSSARSTSRNEAGGCAAGGAPARAARSAPVQKCRPAPRRMTMRTLSSAPSLASCPASSSSIVWSNALPRSGRLSVIVAMRRGDMSTERVWRATQSTSPKQLADDLDPARNAVVDLVRLEECRLEAAVLGAQPALHRRYARHRGQVVGLLQHPLPILRGEEVDQEPRGVRMRRVLEDADGVERDRHRLHLDPVRRRALLGADHGVVVERHQAHRIFAGDHLIKDRTRGRFDVHDAL